MRPLYHIISVLLCLKKRAQVYTRCFLIPLSSWTMFNNPFTLTAYKIASYNQLILRNERLVRFACSHRAISFYGKLMLFRISQAVAVETGV
jgi:hypothetical protein